MADRPTDIDLMLYLDGELPPEEARRVETGLEGSGDGRRVVESLGQVGECVRTYVELAADESGAALDGLWARIEQGIQADDAAAAHPAAPAAAFVPPPRDDPEREGGMWAALGRWLDGMRGYFVTGVVAAGVAAAVVMLLQKNPTRIIERAAPPVAARQVALKPQPPQIENLEVYHGQGTVLTIPNDDGSDTAVIWLSPDKNNVEGPI